MNTGYLSFLLMTATAILLATGWKDVFVRGIPHRFILLFFVLWLGFSFASFPFPAGSVNGVVFVLAFYITGALIRLGGWNERIRAATMGVLLAILVFTFERLAVRSPVVTLTSPGIDTALLCAALSALLFRRPLFQLTALSIGLLLGSGAALLYVPPGRAAEWGGPEFWDRWWLAVCFARVLSVAVSLVVAGWKALLLRTGNGR